MQVITFTQSRIFSVSAGLIRDMDGCCWVMHSPLLMASRTATPALRAGPYTLRLSLDAPTVADVEVDAP